MINYFRKTILIFTLLLGISSHIHAQDSVVDQVIWVVGDEAILKSDVETTKVSMQMSGEHFDGDPYCIIPEQIAYQKLFLHQAKIDSIDIPASAVSRGVEQQLKKAVAYFGSVEKAEEYLGKTVKQLRLQWKDQIRDNEIIEKEQSKIIGDLKVTPSEVRTLYESLPKDSLPFIQATVEGQIIVQEPKIPLSAIDAVKAKLRDYRKRIEKGETTFSALALLYSEDTESAKKGGELGYLGRGELVPEFASTAFALTDPTKVSNIIQTEYGYHIIQLIDRKDDKVNVRHILLRPQVSQSEIKVTMQKMDSLRNFILKDSISFEHAAVRISSDKGTRNNNGLMVNKNQYSPNAGTSRFMMEELPPEVAKVVDKMKVGEVSKPFTMINNDGKKVVLIVKLRDRVAAHRANIIDDYQILKNIAEADKRKKMIDEWLQKKIKETYVWIAPDWRNCDFKYKGWVK